MNIQYAYERCGNMKKEQTNPPTQKDTNPTDKLPEELKAIYNGTRKSSAAVESLKVAAALKLWVDRGYRQLGFGVESDVDGKTFYVDVLAHDARGMVGVECACSLNMGRLRRQIEQLRGCLTPDSYIIAVFPSNVGERVKKAIRLVDEVWVTGKNGKVESMMFMSVFHKG
jgi:hypothetical protein